MNNNVLLIGGTGILSSDVCKQAIKEGFNVYILNRGTRKYNIDPNAHLITCDIRNENVQDIRVKLNDIYFDIIVDFLSMDVDNLQKSLSIIKGKCDQYVFISSATVYMKHDENVEITEETPIENNLWDYASKKIGCEEFLTKEYEKYCKEYTIIRPYVTYGKTRIPYAIIPGNNWTLVNRIKLGKPVVLWNHGQVRCTITNTKDFAVGVVGLFNNQKAYAEAFHITSDFRMTWKEVIDDVIKTVGTQCFVADMKTDDIVSYLPEYAGVLYGDKSTDMIFDNSKIKEVVPKFESRICFKEGIAETINFMQNNPELQKIDYAWEGRIDWMLYKYYKHDKGIKSKLHLGVYDGISKKDSIKYLINRYCILHKMYTIVKGH